jgi:hypothetical protein
MIIAPDVVPNAIRLALIKRVGSPVARVAINQLSCFRDEEKTDGVIRRFYLISVGLSKGVGKPATRVVMIPDIVWASPVISTISGGDRVMESRLTVLRGA